MIAILANSHVRQQPWPRQTLLDRQRRLLSRHYRAALRAGVLLAGFLHHTETGRHVFQPLADLLADVTQLALALRALPLQLAQIVDHPAPFE